MSEEKTKKKWGNKDTKWELVQIKAFKAWINGYLESKPCGPVETLDADLQDGVRLNTFLELAAEKKMPKWDKNPMIKIQKLQNLSIGLNYIQNDLAIRLVGIGAEDIYDGNTKLILGTLYSLYRKLRIATISAEGKSSEDGLLVWIQKMTEGYDGVDVKDFKNSFNDGLAFSALCHRFNPDSLDFDSINKEDPQGTLDTAFNTAEKHIGIPQLLDSIDLVEGTPDERSVILYCSLFFHAFVSNEERLKVEQSKRAVQDKLSDLESKLLVTEEEKNELLKKAQEMAAKYAELEEQNSKLSEQVGDLVGEIDYMRERAVKDAEAMVLLEEEGGVAMGNLVEGSGERNALSSTKDRLQSELEALNTRRGLGDDEAKSFDSLKLTSEDERARILSELDARMNALKSQIEDLKKQLARETELRKKKSGDVLRLESEMEKLRKKLIVQRRAWAGLEALKLNLEEHLEDVYAWRDLHHGEVETGRTFDLKAVTDAAKEKTFSDQVSTLSDGLQEENKNLLRIIKLKDSKYQLQDIETKSGWLTMKGRKEWKKRFFSIKGNKLFYYESEDAERYEGLVDLSLGCDVVRQKAVKEEGEAKKLWPLKITVGERKLFVRAATKKERHSWYLFLASKIAHLNYVKAHSEGESRPDPRLVSLFASETVPAVYLDASPLDTHATNAIAKTLPAHDETEVLSLNGADLDDGKIGKVAEVFEKLSIKELVLSNNKISGAGLAAIAKGLATNSSVTHIRLDHNEIDDSGVESLVELLSKKNFQELDLSHNKITCAGVAHLTKALAGEGRSLPKLQLSGNQIGNEGAKAIAELLVANAQVGEVDLCCNNVGDEGATALASALHTNINLNVLNLAHNAITNAGAAAFEEALEKNKALNRLDISENKGIKGSSDLKLLANGEYTFPGLSVERC